MALTITEVSPVKVPPNGGFKLLLTGTFLIGHRYAVYIGDVGSTVDPICFSGIPGQANDIYPLSATTLRAYTPALVPNAVPYHVAVLDLDTLEAFLFPDSITVQKKGFVNSVYAMRKPQPPIYRTGPRGIEKEDPVS